MEQYESSESGSEYEDVEEAATAAKPEDLIALTSEDIKQLQNQLAPDVFETLKGRFTIEHDKMLCLTDKSAEDTDESSESEVGDIEVARTRGITNLSIAGTVITGSDFDELLKNMRKFLKEVGLGKKPKGKKKNNAGKPKRSAQTKFPAYWALQEVHDGLMKGDLLRGVVRINLRNNRKAYARISDDGAKADCLLATAIDRNRALEGDVVALKLKPNNEWVKNRRTAVVVYILERVHSRFTVGKLQPMPDNNKQFALLIPRDFRLPSVRVLANVCPPDFHQQPHKYKKSLFRGKITTWSDTRYAVGTILETVGRVGDLEVETSALLLENDLDVTPFRDDFENTPVWEAIPVLEIEHREDLRKNLIFTIDPATAHDLDDALSYKELPNGNVEVGVHISDVAHYLKEDLPLDKLARKRGTSIYLINKVYHLFPREFLDQCSLVPRADKLTFSVFWEITDNCNIVGHRFARTVINSCAKLSHEDAQDIIEHKHSNDKPPETFNGFTYNDLKVAIRRLFRISMILRAQRLEEGALHFHRIQLIFKLDDITGEPSEVGVYENREANKMIEELMLLANRTVAQRIVDSFPKMAILRCHKPPNERMLETQRRIFKRFDIMIDTSSSKQLQHSLWRLQHKSVSFAGDLIVAAVNYRIMKLVMRAEYLCSATAKSPKDYFHYGLNVPMYTHFTSPIRRYVDIAVHRLLEASLGYTKKHQWKVKQLTAIASNCNKQRWNARCAEEESSHLYLAYYVEKHQPFIRNSVVVDVRKYSFDVLVAEIGSIIRIYPKKLGDNVQYSCISRGLRKQYMLIFPSTREHGLRSYKIELFTILKVNVFRKHQMRRLDATLVP